jgi:hypothetical protein
MDGLLRPVACKVANVPIAVKDYIDQANTSWNVGKLNIFFLPMDVDIITNIHLSTRRQEDF